MGVTYARQGRLLWGSGLWSSPVEALTQSAVTAPASTARDPRPEPGPPKTTPHMPNAGCQRGRVVLRSSVGRARGWQRCAQTGCPLGVAPVSAVRAVGWLGGRRVTECPGSNPNPPPEPQRPAERLRASFPSTDTAPSWAAATPPVPGLQEQPAWVTLTHWDPAPSLEGLVGQDRGHLLPQGSNLPPCGWERWALSSC